MSDEAAPNRYCAALGVSDARLEDIKDKRQAGTYAMLIVALVEAGGPMTLAAVASRFERAGVAPAAEALARLKKCRPGRPPVYRDGDLYDVDPRSDETRVWMFRLGLRGPRVAPAAAKSAPPAAPVRSDDDPLDATELALAWRDLSVTSLSVSNVVLGVLDVYRHPMSQADIAQFLDGVSHRHLLHRPQPHLGRRGSPLAVDDAGIIAIAGNDGTALRKVRRMVRERLAMLARHERPSAAEIEERGRQFKRSRLTRALELQQLRRALVHGYPAEAPRVVVVLDLAAHEAHQFRVASAADKLDARTRGRPNNRVTSGQIGHWSANRAPISSSKRP